MSEVTRGAEEPLTIDGLARQVGMTARNIRAHQSRGLLPPPDVRGRTGFYGPEHVERLELIKELQGDGFNLEAIRRLIDGANGSTADVLRFTRAVHAPFEEEEPQIVASEELMARWGRSDPNPELVDAAVELGLLRPIGDDRFEERSPQLARASIELAELGMSPEEILELAKRLRRQADSVAKEFVKLFVEQVWGPFREEGSPEERWPEIVETLERLRPLAADSLLAIFKLAMTDRVDEAMGRELEVLGDPRKTTARRGTRAPRRRSRRRA